MAEFLDAPDCATLVSAINLGEVYYILQRRRGVDAAREAVHAVFQQPRMMVADATWDRIEAAAEIKVGGGLSYADAFAAALALETDAVLLTGDPEFRELERRRGLRVLWMT